MKYASFPPPEVGRARTHEQNRLAAEAALAAIPKTDADILAAKYWTPDKTNKPVEATGEQVQAELNLGNDILVVPQANPNAGWKKASEAGFIKVAPASVDTTPAAAAPAPTPAPDAAPENPAVVSTDPRRIELEKLPNPLLLKEAQAKGVNVDPAWSREQVINAILAT